MSEAPYWTYISDCVLIWNKDWNILLLIVSHRSCLLRERKREKERINEVSHTPMNWTRLCCWQYKATKYKNVFLRLSCFYFFEKKRSHNRHSLSFFFIFPWLFLYADGKWCALSPSLPLLIFSFHQALLFFFVTYLCVCAGCDCNAIHPD